MKKIVINILVCILMLGMTQQFLPVTAQSAPQLLGISEPGSSHQMVNVSNTHVDMHRHALDDQNAFIPPTAETLQLTQEQVQSFDCSSVTDVPQIECEALVNLYESTSGALWKNNSNWLDSNEIGTWFGVNVSDGHVTELKLNNNQLSNTIPNELGNLNNLTYLDLSINQLSGSIPSGLGNLSNLQYLYLNRNNLSGSIPSELGNLTNLRILDLWSNWLSGSIPPELGNLTNLLELSLRFNILSGSIPTELGNLTNLITLYLHSNELSSSIPSELGNLTNLNTLFLAGNQLSGLIPSELGNLTNLSYLGLGGNQLSGMIPSELGNLTNLQHLNLVHNQLFGVIPPEFENLTKLFHLNLGGNQLSGTIPSYLGNLTDLRFLGLGSNQLSGTIPSELLNLTYLHILELGDNQLSGTIPPALGNLTNLIDLDLSWNQLSGEIPSTLNNLTKLMYLYLGENQLSEKIPSELGDLTNLRKLELASNNLSSTIPIELGNLTNLHHLDLSHNELEGDIPESFINLVDLCTSEVTEYPCYGLYGLDLGNNQLNVAGYSQILLDFLSNTNPNWHLTQSVDVIISGENGGTISYGNTEISIPPDAVLGEVTFTFSPNIIPNYDTGNLSFAGNSFELTAQDSIGNSITTFDQPLIITLNYDGLDLGEIPEENLYLFYWNEDSAAWVDVATTCESGTYTRNFEDNWLSVPICHLSEFALLGMEEADVNTAPVAEDQSVETDQDTPLQITLTASDPDGDPLTYIIVDGPDSGTLDFDPVDLPMLTYTPNPGYFGQDNFTFKVNDGESDSNIATITITISEKEDVNTAPVAEDQSVETDQDTPIQITLTASDPDGDKLTYIIVDGPDNGTLDFDPVDLPTLTYTPNPGWFGQDNFTFKVNDGELDSNIATVTIIISEKEDVNTAPVAEDQSVETTQDTPVQITLSAYDADGDPLTYIIVDEPDYGTLDYDPDDLPTLTYTSNPGWFGQDSFTFKAYDGVLYSNIATVTITVSESGEPSVFMIFLPLITK